MNYLKNKWNNFISWLNAFVRTFWNNLNPTIKRYVISSVNTFLATFFASLSASIAIIDKMPEKGLESTFWFSAISASLVTGIRAVIKVASEKYFVSEDK